MRATWRFLPTIAMLAIMATIVLPSGRTGANVTAVIAFPVPNTVNSAAQYTIVFTTGAAGALVEDAGTISIEFTSGTGMPTSVPAGSVTVNNVPTNSVGTVNSPVPAPPRVSGLTLIITTPVAIANATAVTVFIAQDAGLTNPSSGKVAKAKVSTSAEAA